MADFYFRPQIHTDVREGWYDFVRFLTDDHPTETGPAWTVVDADDTSDRSQPSGPNNNLTELGGTNLFNPDNAGIPPLGSWIVLESLDSNNSNHMQVWIHFQSSTVTEIRLMPFEDFSAGGGSTGGSNPTFPTINFGTSAGSSLSWSFVSTTARYLGNATEGNFIFLGTNFNDEEYVYVGELDGAADASTGASPPDDRCYVMNRTTADVHFDVFNSTPYIRVSPLDDSTVITSSGPIAPQGAEGDWLCNQNQDWPRVSIGGDDLVFGVGVQFTNSGHEHFAGWFRNLRMAPGDLGLMGTLQSRQWLHYGDSRSASPQASIAIKWDGTTKFP